jgi:hypothetical protein
MSNHILEDFKPNDWCFVEEHCWYNDAVGEVVKVIYKDLTSVLVKRVNYKGNGYEDFYANPEDLAKCVLPSQTKIGQVYKIIRSSFEYCSDAREQGLANGQRVKILDVSPGFSARIKPLDNTSKVGLEWNFLDKCSGVKNIGFTLFVPCVEESTKRVINSADYCRCSSPDLINNFSGIASGGKSFSYCRICKKERL